MIVRYLIGMWVSALPIGSESTITGDMRILKEGKLDYTIRLV